MTCHECGSKDHTTSDCPRWGVIGEEWANETKGVAVAEEAKMKYPAFDVWVVLNSGKMIVVPWVDELGSDEYDARDACEQCAQALRAGQAVLGRMVDESGPSGQFRWISLEPRSIELVFTNA
jgi:hypothetical protein